MQLIDLRTGEGIIFAPSGLRTKPSPTDSLTRVVTFGQDYLLVQSRERITLDGGHSMLAVRDETMHTRIGRVAVQNATRSAVVTMAEPALSEMTALNSRNRSSVVCVAGIDYHNGG